MWFHCFSHAILFCFYLRNTCKHQQINEYFFVVCIWNHVGTIGRICMNTENSRKMSFHWLIFCICECVFPIDWNWILMVVISTYIWADILVSQSECTLMNFISSFFCNLQTIGQCNWRHVLCKCIMFIILLNYFNVWAPG